MISTEQMAGEISGHCGQLGSFMVISTLCCIRSRGGFHDASGFALYVFTLLRDTVPSSSFIVAVSFSSDLFEFKLVVFENSFESTLSLKVSDLVEVCLSYFYTTATDESFLALGEFWRIFSRAESGSPFAG